MGWTLRFFLAALTGSIPSDPPGAFWEGYAGSAWAVVTHAVALGLGVLVVSRGVRGIEAATRVMIPTLAVLVGILAVRAVTLPGASEGLAFLFTPTWSDLASPGIWLQALTQNAWDTGAGWGLVLCYAIYARSREDTALNAFVIGFGNNAMSLLAGIMVLCTVFSVMPAAATEIVGAGNEGLTFIWVPQLFDTLPAGRWFLAVFFLALLFAAWSSLIAMIELASRVLVDLGLERTRAIAVVGVAGLIFGTPSALSLGVFGNQDFVWGVGLMLSGFFFAVAVLRYGVTRWRQEFVNTGDSDITIGAWWDWAIRLVALEAVVLIAWWLWQVRGEGFAANWNPFETFNIGTVVAQWTLVLLALLSLNGVLVASTRKSPH
jgi:NSS family neurotransmitter:Na+ symporter